MDKKYAKPWSQPALSNATGTGPWKEGDAFSGVQALYYWSSTPLAAGTNSAWGVHLGNGYVYHDDKTNTNYVWPVRRRQ